MTVVINVVLINDSSYREDIEIIAMLFQSVKSLYQIFTIGNRGVQSQFIIHES